MDQPLYKRSGSISHIPSNDEVDFKEFIDQIDEYEKALGERLQVYHEDTNEAKLS